MRATLLAAVLLLAPLSACGDGEQGAGTVPATADDAQPGSPVVVVTHPDAGVVVEASDVFALRVEANPSVGYAWEVVDAGDAGVVRDEGFFYVGGEDAQEPVAGASVDVDFRFTALAPGTTTIVLQRSYRGEDEGQEQRRAYEVTVN